jgi:hypothetical protein
VLTKSIRPNAPNQVISIQISVKDCNGNAVALNGASLTESANSGLNDGALALPYSFVYGGQIIQSGVLHQCNLQSNGTYSECTDNIGFTKLLDNITFNLDYSNLDFFVCDEEKDPACTKGSSTSLYEVLTIGGVQIDGISDQAVTVPPPASGP